MIAQRVTHSFWHRISFGYHRHIVQEGKEETFWILVAFVVTFIIVRLVTHAIRAERGPFRNLSVGGTHIHHLVPGIFILIITGYLSNAVHLRASRTAIAAMFGVGAALTLDEFALWFHLRDVYWQKEGRRSIDIVILAAAIAGLVVLGSDFWRDVFRAIGRVA